ncbi:MAG TPA: LexA family transcriptional regulator [Bacteroidetes bacterium]|nr:LexA family transcriptional regulator [Bacteroidota bacterium]
MSHLPNNLKLLRKRKHRTQDDVAQALSIKRSTYSGYENGVAEPGVDGLLALSRYFHVAVDTLLTVDLSALSESQLYQLEHGSDVYIRGSGLRVLATTIDQSNRENIELVPEKAKAGYRTGYADPEYISELPRFQLPFLSPERKYRTFQLQGDSMLPIPHGAWVTGEYVTDWENLVTGQACVVFTLDDGIVFKIVENLIREEGILRLFSLNPLYPPYEVPVGEIKEIWKFVHYISEEIPDPVLPEEKLLSTVAQLKNEVERIKSRMKSR